MNKINIEKIKEMASNNALSGDPSLSKGELTNLVLELSQTVNSLIVAVELQEANLKMSQLNEE